MPLVRAWLNSFCCVPAGVFITRLVPLFMLVVVEARSAIGVVFLTVAVTPQVVAGRIAMMCVAPAALTAEVAVSIPVAPGEAWRTSSDSSDAFDPVLPKFDAMSSSSVIPAGAVHVDVAAFAKWAMIISFAPVVVMLGVACDVPATVDWPFSTSTGFVGSAPEYTTTSAAAFCALPRVQLIVPSLADAIFR